MDCVTNAATDVACVGAQRTLIVFGWSHGLTLDTVKACLNYDQYVVYSDESWPESSVVALKARSRRTVMSHDPCSKSITLHGGVHVFYDGYRHHGHAHTCPAGDVLVLNSRWPAGLRGLLHDRRVFTSCGCVVPGSCTVHLPLSKRNQSCPCALRAFSGGPWFDTGNTHTLAKRLPPKAPYDSECSVCMSSSFCTRVDCVRCTSVVCSRCVAMVSACSSTRGVWRCPSCRLDMDAQNITAFMDARRGCGFPEIRSAMDYAASSLGHPHVMVAVQSHDAFGVYTTTACSIATLGIQGVLGPGLPRTGVWNTLVSEMVGRRDVYVLVGRPPKRVEGVLHERDLRTGRVFELTRSGVAHELVDAFGVFCTRAAAGSVRHIRDTALHRGAADSEMRDPLGGESDGESESDGERGRGLT